MNFELHEKIRKIRIVETLGRGSFSELTGVNKRTLEAIENKGTDPRCSFIKKICSTFPEYTHWLILDKTYIDIGQISPDIKILWERHAHELNIHDEFDRFNEIHLDTLLDIVKANVLKVNDTDISLYFSEEDKLISNFKRQANRGIWEL